MALVFRQTITTNRNEVYALGEAIDRFILQPVLSDRKMAAAAFLSLEPLRKLGTRLNAKWQLESNKPKRKACFTFTFHPAEIVAIRICIQNFHHNPFLDVILGKVHQSSLNFENVIELNHKSLVK